MGPHFLVNFAEVWWYGRKEDVANVIFFFRISQVPPGRFVADCCGGWCWLLVLLARLPKCHSFFEPFPITSALFC